MMANRTAISKSARTALDLNAAAARSVAEVSRRQIRRQPRDPAWSFTYQSVVETLAQGLPEECDSAPRLRAVMEAAMRFSVGRRPPSALANAAGVPAIWVGKEDERRIFLYLHGGGYISGSPWTHLGLLQQLADASHSRILAPDYRLAPEAPYPAALEDAWSAYWWLLQQGASANDIVVAGDSAGGGLTIALLLALRDAGAPLPAAGICLSPWLDLAHTGRSVHTNASRDYLNLPIMRGVAALYADRHDLCEPLISPLYADLHGLPPLMVQVGADEMLLDDSRRLVRAALDAGVSVELEIWESMVHVWHFFYAFEPRARQAIRRVGCFARAHSGQQVENGPAY